ncbi:UNVERIFIED_CONTAM: hypothetical protein FKN15_051912 [Acipenser sinensis]
MYTDPPLELTPQFSPKIKDYYSEVPFDVVTVKIRAEPVDCRCQVHLDDRKGPRMANYPVGLGSSRINILVVDESQPEPVVMTIYTLNIYRENRPSLPIFDEYMMCGFLQKCSRRKVQEMGSDLQLSRLSWLKAATCFSSSMINTG